MGKLGNGIIGSIQGSIGNITGYRRKHNTVIATKRGKQNYESTQLQLDARAKFLQVKAFIEVLKAFPYGLKYWKPRVKLLPENLAYSLNADAFNADGVIDASLIVTSIGKLAPGLIVAANSTITPKELFVYWISPASNLPSSDFDGVNLIYYNERTKLWHQGGTGLFRISGDYGGGHGHAWQAGDIVHFYLSFVSQDYPEFASLSNHYQIVVTAT